MITAQRSAVIRLAKPNDKAQIDAIRRPYYMGFPLMDDPAIRYVVAERDGKVTACYGMKLEDKRALIIDCYGTNARDLTRLIDHLVQSSDKLGIELSAWVAKDNHHIKYFHRRGFKDEATLIRRQPQGSK